MNFPKIFILTLLITGQASASEAPRDPLVFLLRNPWTSLDPAATYDMGSFLIIGNVYESLIAFESRPDHFKPWLSREVPSHKNGLISADERDYIFPLRSDVKFHDGSVMSAEDVRYSFFREMFLEEKGESTSLLLRPLLGVDFARDRNGRWNIDSKEAERAIRIEGNKVIFHLRAPVSGFLALIASWPVITSKRWAVAHGDWDGTLPLKGARFPAHSDYLRDHADGTGPYRVEKADIKTAEALLSAHSGYWGKAPETPHILVRSEPSDAIRESMLIQGDADYAYLERSNLPLLKGVKGVKVIDDGFGFSSGETIFLTLDIDPVQNPRLGSGKLDGKGVPPDFFKDKDVRQGFAYAFDDRAYLATAIGGKGLRAAGPIPEVLLKSGGATNPYHYDFRAAEASLRRAQGGAVWDKGFALTVSYPRGSVARQIACEILKTNLEKLNPKFHITIEAPPPDVYAKEYESHRLPIFIRRAPADYPDAQALAFQFLHSNGYFPRAQRLADPELDRLEEEAAAELDPSKKDKLFLALEKKALENAYQIYTYFPIEFNAVSSGLRGLDKDQAINGLSFLNLIYFPPLKE